MDDWLAYCEREDVDVELELEREGINYKKKCLTAEIEQLHKKLFRLHEQLRLYTRYFP